MNKWQEIKLGGLIDINQSSIGRNYEFENIRYYDISSIGTGVAEDPKNLSISEAPSRAKRIIKDGDTILATVRPGNRSFYYFKKARENDIASTGFAVISPKNNLIDNKFLYYLTSAQSFTNYLVSNEQGATYPAITPSVINRVKINLPPLPTQQKIAKILSNYDDLIENNLKRIKLLEESARLTYEEWFLRFRIDGKKLDIDTATGLPFEWEVRKISDFVDTASGGTPSRRKPEEFYKDGTIPWVKTKELKNFMIIDADEHITEQGLKKSSAKMFPANTVLLAMYGNTIGEVTFSTFPTSTNQACCAFLVKDKAYLSYFIHQYLLKNKQKILGYRMGAAQENISQQIIKSIEIEIPSESLLQLFGKRLSEKYNLIKSLHTQNQLLKEARDILLPRLMTGMIDTDNMDIAV